MMSILCIIVIDALLLINDMLETDKVGPFYFIAIALIVNQDLKNKRVEQSYDHQNNDVNNLADY